MIGLNEASSKFIKIHPTGQNSHTVMKARRPRAARACDLCRAKKNKCDELYPCSYCKNRGQDCVFKGADPSWRHLNSEYVRQLEDQVKTLTKHLDDSSRGRGLHPASSSLNNGLSPMVQHEGEHAATRSYQITLSRQTKGREVSGVNQYTRNVEFYGASSSVALLLQVQSTLAEPVPGSRQSPGPEIATDACSIVSSLHNPTFSPTAVSSLAHTPEPLGVVASVSAQGSPSVPGPAASIIRGYYPQCRGFLQNYFSTLHYIHPILDKNLFMARCENLWAHRTEEVAGQSFLALYYSILSLGALVGERDDEPIDGIDNAQWSKMFFDAAGDLASRLGMTTNLDMVQCYFFMAKVCQNKLNAHGSYILVGLAVRTALAMGINRRPGPGTLKDGAELRAESRTWWGLYSLETELSFAMGRPDTLGADAYHNQRFPTVLCSNGESATPSEQNNLEPTYCGIIKAMVDFSRIIRSICLGVYLPEVDCTHSKIVAVAEKIEQDLENWADSLPENIRPTKSPAQQPRCLRNAKEPNWVKRQRLVLTIRYFNLRILLFGSFLHASTSSSSEPSCVPSYWTGIQKGLDAAKQTVEIIYHTYQMHDFFRTWFYNTTYIVFAASIILVYILQQGSNGTTETIGPWLKLVSMAVEVLESMDECVVAMNAAGILQDVLQRLEKKLSLPKSQGTTSPDNRTAAIAGDGSKPRVEPGDCAGRGGDTITAFNYHGLVPLSFMDGSSDAGFPLQMADLDGINWLLSGLENNSS